MKLVFFDEVKSQPDYPHYHLGAICIDEDSLTEIEAEIAAIAQQVFEDDRLKRSTEFHATDLYGRAGLFKEFSDFSQRVEILISLLRILSREDVKRIDIQINTDKLHSSQSAKQISFMFLCERANDFIKSQKSMGMLIGDREDDKTSERFSVGLSEYSARGTDFAFGRDIKNLCEAVYFTHSHLSRSLQLADIYAWILQFRNRHINTENKRHKYFLNRIRQESIDPFPSKYKEWPK